MLASVFKVAPESITNLFRFAVIVVPLIVFFVTRSVCRSLARDKAHPFGGSVGTRIRRTPAGGYEDIEEDGHGNGPATEPVAVDHAAPYRRPSED